MSGGELDLRLAELHAAAPQFDAGANAVQQTLATLQSSLAAEEGCWGSGEIGSEFAKHYLPHHEQAVTNLTTLATALGTTAAAVTDAASAFEHTETHNASPFIGPVTPR